MKLLKTILVAVDFDHTLAGVLAAASALAKKFGSGGRARQRGAALHDCRRRHGRGGGAVVHTGAGRDRCPRLPLIIVDGQHRPIGTVSRLDLLAALARSCLSLSGK